MKMNKKPRIIIFGIGTTCKYFFDNYNNEYDIIGLSDWDKSKHGKALYGYKIIDPYEINRLDYDFILIMSVAVNAIADQLKTRCRIENNRLRILKNYYVRESPWTIGILLSDNDFNITEPFSNPILTKRDVLVENIQPTCVADPFVFEKSGSYYMFYEVLGVDKTGKDKGIINLAESKDGIYY